MPRLQHLEQDLALLPVGWGADRKGPMLEGWQHHPCFTVAQLQADRSMRSVGARTGLLTEPMLCFDFDGATASLELSLDPGWVSSCWAIAVGIAVSVLTELHVTGPCHSFSLLQRCRIRRSKASGDVRALVMNRWHAALRVPLRGD